MSGRHIPRIYYSDALQTGAVLPLDSATAHHLTRVLRMQPGDELVVFNGQGGEYQAQIHSSTKTETQIQVGAQQAANRESPLQITLLQAVVRGERMDLSIGKAVELGVHAIQPLMLTRSQGIKATQLQRKEKHWQAVAQSAAEQSGRTVNPKLHATSNLSDWLAKQPAYDLKLLLHPELDNAKPEVHTTPHSLALLIGPEGGLSDEEVSLATSAGFQGLTLGPRILRTETAAMAAITACQLRWGDL